MPQSKHKESTTKYTFTGVTRNNLATSCSKKVSMIGDNNSFRWNEFFFVLLGYHIFTYFVLVRGHSYKRRKQYLVHFIFGINKNVYYSSNNAVENQVPIQFPK